MVGVGLTASVCFMSLKLLTSSRLLEGPGEASVESPGDEKAGDG